MEEILEFCEICGAPLDANNCHGEKDFPLCLYHHEMFGKALAFLIELGGNEKRPQQLSLPLEEGEK